VYYNEHWNPKKYYKEQLLLFIPFFDNEHWNPNKYYKEQLLLFIPSFDNEHTFKGDHSTLNVACNMHEIHINLLKKHVYIILTIIMHTQQIGKI